VEFIPGLIIAAVAFAVGYLSSKTIAPNARRVKKLEAELNESKMAQAAYKKQVAEHFSESADLFSDITEKYRSLYEHMSTGASSLCERRNIPRELANSHVNILSVETPEITPKLNDHGVPMATESSAPEEQIVDVSRPGLSPLDPKSQQILEKNKQNKNETNDKSAEIIDLESQRNEASKPAQQAKDYAIKAKGIINHNSLDQNDVST